LRGLPPNLPFARDDAAFRFDLTEPRHAGQNETRSIRWVGHFGIALPPKTWKISLHSNVLGSSNSMGSNLASARRPPAAYNGFGVVYGFSTR
jgi:hypothetical protein